MKQTGRLNVRVYTSQAEIPLMGATVAVLRRVPSGKYELISIQATDSSGSIQPVVLETPERQESTEPMPGIKPFTTCDVWAEHAGFAMLRVDGVQVFPGVDTYQGMELIPLPQGESSLIQTTPRETPAQDL